MSDFKRLRETTALASASGALFDHLKPFTGANTGQWLVWEWRKIAARYGFADLTRFVEQATDNQIAEMMKAVDDIPGALGSDDLVQEVLRSIPAHRFRPRA